ncbi:MAG: hypothetical protein WC548_02240 [Candidatus Pacearchaeota archaeon]
MMLGILLGISLSLFLTSVFIIFGKHTEIFKENLITGATIGTGNLISCLSLTLFISLIFIVFLSVILKKRISK